MEGARKDAKEVSRKHGRMHETSAPRTAAEMGIDIDSLAAVKNAEFIRVIVGSRLAE